MSARKNYCDRSLHNSAVHFALFIDDASFQRELRRLKIKEDVKFARLANCRSFTNAKGSEICLVCINLDKHPTMLEVYSSLVHEAVHVWQNHCKNIGEKRPSKEFEAYGIERIARGLMEAHARLTAKPTSKPARQPRR